MNRSRDMDFYGSGVIMNTMRPSLDERKPLIHQREVHKDPIRIAPDIKVHPTLGKNYIKDFQEESIDKLNYDERDELQLNQAIDYLEAQPNEDFDFDGDGQTDFVYSEGELRGKQAEHADEVGEMIEEGENKIEEKSIEEAPKHEIIKDVKANEELKDEPKEILNGNKDVRLNNIDARSNESIKLSDMLTIGTGSLALAMMLMGNNI